MLNQIDEPGTAEERIAARLVEELELSPPVDVEALARSLADVTVKIIPFDGIDGLCLDLKVSGKRPKIWVSDGAHRVRRRFTLAHEIGHIKIPWHIGNIIDKIDGHSKIHSRIDRQIEAEANRFAAELLMPNVWMCAQADRFPHPGHLMNYVAETADVSYEAALYRTIKFSKPGYIGAYLRDNMVCWSGKTTGTLGVPPERRSHITDMDVSVLEDEVSIKIGDRFRYVWWKIREKIEALPKPIESWRTVLQEILVNVPEDCRENIHNRVNATVGAVIGKFPIGSDVNEMYRLCRIRCANRNDTILWVKYVFDHPSFDSYLLGRCHDRAKT
ncbi:ImmA/IrrE family metallo-endopeptidase [uncultured Sphingomonas sp.]|uniref:ImmA/IrrE family metallo-endopeptidase n=1 Tax=uncultured Sphingomonas sp. TaxID=158754 RepID=UPI0025D35196|nr:ImmA/IrrE family metallo-endopeptidase [uncultured Sphingomonas sp.]